MSRLLCSLFALALLPSAAHAAVIDWTDGGADNSWVDPANWGGNPVTSGNTYVVTSDQVTASGDLSFDGDLLRMQNFNAVIFTGGNSFSGNVELNNGGVIRHNRSGTVTVGGTLDLPNNNGIVESNGSNNRIIQLDALISGTGNALIGGSTATNGVVITNAANTFSGVWETQNSGFFRTTAQGTLGTGSIEVDSGTFDAEYDLDATLNSLLMTGGVYELDTFSHTYAEGGVTIGTLVLEAGTYTVGELNTIAQDEGLDPASFTGTTGTLTVIPEPGSLALLALGGLCLLRRRPQPHAELG